MLQPKNDLGRILTLGISCLRNSPFLPSLDNLTSKRGAGVHLCSHVPTGHASSSRYTYNEFFLHQRYIAEPIHHTPFRSNTSFSLGSGTVAQMDEHTLFGGGIYKVCDVSCRCAAVVVPTRTKRYKRPNVAQGVNHANSTTWRFVQPEIRCRR